MSKNRVLSILLVSVFLFGAVFTGVLPESAAYAASSDVVKVTISNESGSYKWFARPDLTFTSATDTVMTTINVNPFIKYQQHLGMGSSFDESSVYNLNRMSPENKAAVLKMLIDPVNGAGLNLWRVCLGTSDYTGRTPYSYDDMPAGKTDETLSSFSIQKDKDYGIIQTLQEAKKYNPDFKIFGSAWSPPGWMKDSGQIDGGTDKSGTILDKYFPVLAEYYRKAINAYAAEGLPLYAITMQNEPSIKTNYPMCYFSLQQQKDFIKILKANFRDSSKQGGALNTKLWVHDHNPGDWKDNNMQAMYDDPQVLSDSDGTAFHDYWKELTIMSEEHDKHPDKDIFLTERSVWGAEGMDRIIQYFRNWARSYDQWVTMLDSNHGPKSKWIEYIPGRTMVVNDAADGNSYYYNPEVYLMGQFARYIKPGAYRIDTNNGSSNTVTNIAYQNPDGSIAVVVVNQSSRGQKFKIKYDGKQIVTALPAKTVGTYTWNTLPPVASTAITPASKVYKAAQSVDVSISGTTTEGAEVRYTTDGSEPTVNSTLYTAPFSVNVTTTAPVTVKAKGFKAGMSGSDIAVATYSVQPAATPTFSLPQGTYMSTPQTVAISCTTKGAEIRYTTDGTNPTAASPLYTGPITVSTTTTIKACAVKAGLSNSPAASAAYTIKLPAPIPGKVESESYDFMSGIQTGGSNGGYIGYFDPGDWVDYMVNVSSAGSRTVTFKIASATTNGLFEVRLVNADGTTSTLATVTVPNTGGWETFQTLTAKVDFASAGEKKLRIHAVGKEFNIDYMDFN